MWKGWRCSDRHHRHIRRPVNIAAWYWNTCTVPIYIGNAMLRSDGKKHTSNLFLGNGKPSAYNYVHMVLSHSPLLITGVIQHRFFLINRRWMEWAIHQFYSLTQNQDPAEKQKSGLLAVPPQRNTADTRRYTDVRQEAPSVNVFAIVFVPHALTQHIHEH